MSDKRRVLAVLSKAELLELGYAFELSVVQRMSLDELRDMIASSKRATLPRIVPYLRRERLKDACEALGLAVSGSKVELIARIVGQDPNEPAQQGLGFEVERTSVDDDRSNRAERGDRGSSQIAAMPAARGVEAAATPSEPEQGAAIKSPTIAGADNEHASDSGGGDDPILARPVPPRRPRLVWHGFDHREITTAVPTQVVEIVRPSRFVGRSGELAVDVSRSSPPPSPDETAVPPNRLIWTNDNLVALQTLLDERDPETRGYRYRGKVDLIYIDPPFMVQSDFRAENAVDIDLDEDEGVQVKKEPSLVEILAYKDTWREGLDSFLSMVRERLVLLRELLARTGSIYVHLDWHAVHYVKVILDEVFGYANFQSEIVWQRTSARSDAQGFAHIHDAILAYAVDSRERYWDPQFTPLDPGYVKAKYSAIDEKTGKRYRLDNLTSPNPRPNMMYTYDGFPPPDNGWRFSLETMREMDAAGLIVRPTGRGTRLQFKRFLGDEGMPMSSLWTDVPPVNSQAEERTGYPTQKPVALLERILRASSPAGGLVIDGFSGSGTTAEAAERLGRQWIAIDNSKYAVHLARKRLIQLHGQPKLGDRVIDYIECEQCGSMERRPKPLRSVGKYEVRPFTLENMGVYQRAESWQGFQTHRSEYRDEMVRVFGGTPTSVSPLLHGEKGATWIHVGPLDSAVVVTQVWAIAREAAATDRRSVTILSADFNTLSDDETKAIQSKLGVRVTVRIIPSSAIDEIKRRIEARRDKPDVPYTSTTIPAFYAPLAIHLHGEARGRLAKLTLVRCEVDIESFLESQRPALKPITDAMTDAARKKAQSEIDRWEKRRRELEKWLAKADSWQRFVDFWAVDWDYGRRSGPDGKPVFETDWQSFRVRRSKKEVEPLAFTAEREYGVGGRYRVAARVTDVFGNDGIATLEIEVG